MTGDPRPTLPVGLKDDFPVLRQLVHGRPIVYLDSGNTSQKPQSVIDAMTHYYEVDNANDANVDNITAGTEKLKIEEKKEEASANPTPGPRWPASSTRRPRPRSSSRRTPPRR